MRSNEVTLPLSREAMKILDELAQESGKSKEELLREGLALRALARSLEKKNQALAVLDSEGAVQERITVT